MEFLGKTCKIRSKTVKSEHDHQILDIQNILGVKFQLRVIILNFWTKLKEKKKKKMKITIELHIFELFLVLNFSFNEQY